MEAIGQKLPRCLTYTTNKNQYRVFVKSCYIGTFTDFRDAIKARNKERLRLTINACKRVQNDYNNDSTS